MDAEHTSWHNSKAFNPSAIQPNGEENCCSLTLPVRNARLVSSITPQGPFGHAPSWLIFKLNFGSGSLIDLREGIVSNRSTRLLSIMTMSSLLALTSLKRTGEIR